FLLLSVALIHLDAALIRQWSNRVQYRRNLEKVNDAVGEEDEKMRRWPLFWRVVFSVWKEAALLLAIGTVVAAVLIRQTVYHRVEMIRGVSQGLMVISDFENAERAVQAALALDPRNDDLMFDLARIKIGRGQEEEGLKIIRRKPVQERSLQVRVLEARALLALRRIGDVAEVVALFPREAQSLPAVAMVLAEFNVVLDKPLEVVKHVAVAAKGSGTQAGLRSLFPYLASRNLWDSIRLADSSLPYATPLQGVIAAEAHFRVNDIAGAANVLRSAMKDRELDPVFLNPVIRVAYEWPTSEWLERFEALLVANLDKLKPSDLALAMEGAFTAGRPDLGWLAYRRMEIMAPGDPMLLIIPAEYGRKWFSFRHEVIGIPGLQTEMVDIKPFLKAASGLSPWKELWERIPLAEELGGIITREGYQHRLKLCLGALEKMEAKNALDIRMQLLWGRVLGELGRWDEAHAKLRAFEAGAPQRHRDFLLTHAELFKLQSDWDACFEALGEFVRLNEHPPLAVWLDLANAAMSLDLGAYAMGCMEEARRDFPESEEWSLVMAGLWSYFGYSEEALFVANRMRNQPHPTVRIKLLMATGRIVEGQKLAMVENLQEPEGSRRQTELLPPAEWVLEWSGGRIGEADYERERKALKKHKAPFLEALNRVKAAWYDNRGRGQASDPAVWEAAGRDPREKAVALNELALLLMRQGRTNEADVVVSKSLTYKPDWSLSWRLKLILASSRTPAPSTTQQLNTLTALSSRARNACPRDPEIWLAQLVAGVREGAGVDWVDREMAAAGEFSPGTLVRAGSFLLSRNYTNAAAVAARAAIKEGHGLLPAAVLGVTTAVKIKDYPWALACARMGAEQALEPWSFYKIIIGLKGRSDKPDADVIQALEGLAAHHPEQSIWSAQLGEMYFRQGQTDRALGVLEDALAREEGKKQAPPRTYLMAAEAARREGRLGRAINILKLCRAKYPDNLVVLNNLVFTLAQEPMAVKEAVDLLPELLKAKRDDFAIYDTVALVYMKAGNLTQAQEYMKKALAMVRKGEYEWLQVYLNAAETQVKLGKYKDAKENLALIMKSPERTSGIEARARELQD
ncbi:MAG: hypothetical protein WCO77_10250, partial [bacterium]